MLEGLRGNPDCLGRVTLDKDARSGEAASEDAQAHERREAA